MAEKEFLQFGGHPLVRSGEMIVYGGLWEPYYCQLKILSKKTENGLEVGDGVSLAIINNDPSVDKDSKKVVRAKYADLGTALLFAKNWLDKN